MPKKILLLLALALLVLGLANVVPGLLLGKNIAVVRPEKGAAAQVVYATGSVEASVMVPIAARSAARLIEMNVDEGSTVKKDDVLARLEDTDVKQALAEAVAREDYAAKAHARMEKLLSGGSVTRRDYDQARSEWDAARATTQRLKAQADYMKLMAPADGTIERRDGEIGQLVAAGQNVFWMSCCAPLRVSAEVDEEDIPLVQPGQKVLLRADAFPDAVFEGKVSAITPKGDAVARSYRVRIALQDKTPLKIGMTAEANIITAEKPEALLLPRTAVREGKVWLVEEGRLKQVPVKTGIRSLKQVEVLEGLGPDAQVVENAAAALREGEKRRAVLKAQDKKENGGSRGRKDAP